jgi:hypothetical protein
LSYNYGSRYSVADLSLGFGANFCHCMNVNYQVDNLLEILLMPAEAFAPSVVGVDPNK